MNSLPRQYRLIPFTLLLGCLGGFFALPALAQFSVTGRVAGSPVTVSSNGNFSITRILRTPAAVPLSGGGFSVRGTVIPRDIATGDFDPQPDPPKPDHWWTGEDHARDVAGDAPGTAVGGLAYGDGPAGRAFFFDGAGAALRFGPTVGNFETNDFSIEFLARSNTRGHAPFLAKREVCNWGNFLDIEDDAVTLVEDQFQKNWADVPFGHSLNDGDWHHVALTRKGPRISLYLDGSPVFNRVFPFITRISNSVDFVAGASPCPPHTGVSPLRGAMDEIKVYNRRVLTPAEIANSARVVRTLTITVQPESAAYRAPVATHTLHVAAISRAPRPEFRTLSYQWFFDGDPIAGATADSFTIGPVDAHSMGRYHVVVKDGITSVKSRDAVVEVHSFPLPRPAHWWPLDGSLTDAVTGQTASAVNGTYFVNGRTGQAFDFRGTNYLDLGGPAGNFGTSDFTITLWLHALNSVVSPTLLGWKAACSAAISWEARLMTDDLTIAQPELDFIGGNFTQIGVAPRNRNHNVKDGAWHHLAFVRLGTNAFVYRNGVRIAAASAQQVANLADAGRLFAGINACNIGVPSPFHPEFYNNPLLGQLDEIKIYDRALVRPEIAAEWRRTPPLLAGPMGRSRQLLAGSPDLTRFIWQIDPEPGQAFSEQDLSGVELEASEDLAQWSAVPGAARLVGGRVELVDADAFAKRRSFYRLRFLNVAVDGPIAAALRAAESELRDSP